MTESRIFISYSRHDTEYVSSLVEALRKQGFEVWFDKNIRTGTDWDDAIEEQLKTADAIVLVLSKTSVASDNVKDEISYAMGLGKQVNPIKIEECEVPMRLARKQFVDFTTMGHEAGFERLVSDLRKNLELKESSHKISKDSFVPPKTKESSSNKAPKSSKKIIPYLIGGLASVVIFVVFIIQCVDDPVIDQPTPGADSMEVYDTIWEDDTLPVNQIDQEESKGGIEAPNSLKEEATIPDSDPAWERAVKMNSVDGYLEYLKNMEYDRNPKPAEEAILALMPKIGVVRFYDRDSIPLFSRLKYYNPVGEIIVKLDKNDLEYGQPGDVLVSRNFIEFVWDIVDDKIMPKEHILNGERVFVLEQDFEQPDKTRLRIAYGAE